ncbi:MAG TPA: hypothetical protein VEF72_13930 [Mycobacterium sp.]|nr:hypothetical protein [Mycobacterium sp.]
MRSVPLTVVHVSSPPGRLARRPNPR